MLYSTKMQTCLSLVHEARLIYAPAAYSMFQLQAKHRHAAGLIDLLFEGRNSLIQLLCHTSRLLTSTPSL